MSWFLMFSFDTSVLHFPPIIFRSVFCLLSLNLCTCNDCCLFWFYITKMIKIIVDSYCVVYIDWMVTWCLQNFVIMKFGPSFYWILWERFSGFGSWLYISFLINYDMGYTTFFFSFIYLFLFFIFFPNITIVNYYAFACIASWLWSIAGLIVLLRKSPLN